MVGLIGSIRKVVFQQLACSPTSKCWDAATTVARYYYNRAVTVTLPCCHREVSAEGYVKYQHGALRAKL